MLLTLFTLVHVVISLSGILSGFFVLFGLLTGRSFDRWTAIFLATTVGTSVTGFLFPVQRFMPSHAVGILSLVILAAAIYARYCRHLNGPWRKVYAISAVLALYLNVFVGIVQAFLRTPVLKALAPTQTEFPFKATQLAVLVVFVALGALAAIRFRSTAQKISIK
jgi:hypothetical protein